MRLRKLVPLEKAVGDAERAGLQKKLGIQLDMARRVIDRLQHLEGVRHAIMNLDQRTTAEIKSYVKPPPAVHLVMKATFLMLGVPEENLKV